MRDFLKACSAEILKLKRTLALRLALLTPMVVVLLQCAFVFRAPRQRLKAGLWPLLEQGVIGWAVLLLPLVASLLAALVISIEHRDGNWKRLFSTPVARWSAYAAKVVAAHLLMALGSAALWLGLIVAGIVLHPLVPHVPYGPPPWLPLAKRLGLVYAASSALIAIHVWISARSESFPIPLGTGVVAVLVSLLAMSDKTMRYWPWLFPANATMDDRWVAALALGTAGGLAISVLGGWDTCRRDVM